MEFQCHPILACGVLGHIAEKDLEDWLVFNVEGKQLPNFQEATRSVSYDDGCKVCFTDGSWVICRFSGTEPVLRIAAEGNTRHQARNLIQLWRSLLKL